MEMKQLRIWALTIEGLIIISHLVRVYIKFLDEFAEEATHCLAKKTFQVSKFIEWEKEIEDE